MLTLILATLIGLWILALQEAQRLHRATRKIDRSCKETAIP